MDGVVGCVGDLLVEIMRQNVGDPLGEPGVFLGPYPSGASGIFIDAVARLGTRARFVGAVGKDDFGDLIIKRFKEDGVDTSQIKIMDDFTTGVAFVTYFKDGGRKFIYHIPRAATGQIFPEDIDPDSFSDMSYLHIAGSTMSMNPHSRQACIKAIDIVTGSGGKISFDPNFRPELISESEIQESFFPVIKKSHIIFPTHEEIAVLTGEIDISKACGKLFDMGPDIIAIKQGKEGSTVYKGDERISVPAFEVEEIDPTGAGDCYCAGFLNGIMRGLDIGDAARLANAVGALAVTRKGPMEGAPTLKEAQKLMNRTA
jgi:sugar/nucleoside kinase (ribokinase family)